MLILSLAREAESKEASEATENLKAEKQRIEANLEKISESSNTVKKYVLCFLGAQFIYHHMFFSG